MYGANEMSFAPFIFPKPIEMIKIRTVSFRGRCARHPDYNPTHESQTPVDRCASCDLLFKISQAHRDLVSLIQSFGPRRRGFDRPRRTQVASLDENQLDLFS
jgi:hypothetical protein